MVSHQANANAKDKIAAIYSLDTSPITGLAVYGDLLFIIESLGSTNGVSPLFGFRTTGFDSSDFSWQIGLFGSVPLLWAINPYKHGWSANKWMWLYLLTAIVALYMLSHLKFTFGGHFMSLVASSDGAIWATFPFWLGWAVGMLLIGLIWFLARYQYHNENNTQG